MALPDWMIQRDVKIEPFCGYDDKKDQIGKLSWGIGSYGYDLRLGYKFRVFKSYPCSIIDPKNFDQRMLEEVECKPGEKLIIPPNSFTLAESFEHMEIPRDVLVIVVGKSTLARCGLIVNVTPLEPEWKGKVTIEISNTAPLPAALYPGEGICQCVFLRSDGVSYMMMKDLYTLLKTNEETKNDFETFPEFMDGMLDGGKSTCVVSYADKKGKYQDQAGITNPKVTEEGK